MSRIHLGVVGLLVGLFLSVADRAECQVTSGAVTGITRVVPSPEYFMLSLDLLEKGDFVKAHEYLMRDFKNCVKVPTATGENLFWLDSICYMAMIGEAHYQMGRYDDALRSFTSAQAIFLNNSNWLQNVAYNGSVVKVERPPFPWGVSSRKSFVGDFTNCVFEIRQETVSMINLGREGTAITQQETRTTIHAGEIVRCLAHTIRRRAEILGPLAKYDPQTKMMAEILGGNPGLPNHFTSAWVTVLYGLALSAMGDDVGATAALKNGETIGGDCDHQLTAIALLELGCIAQRIGQYDTAANAFLEATFACAIRNKNDNAIKIDYILLEEAFRNLANTQRLIDKTKSCPPIGAAYKALAGQREGSPLVLCTLAQELAEDAAVAGNLPVANELLTKADGLMARRAMAETRYGARNLYLGALVAYLAAWGDYTAGKNASPAAGDKKLEAALGFMRKGSLWLYHLSGIEMMFQNSMISNRGDFSVRAAEEIYERLLREPSAYDWATQPMDSLAVMTFAPPEAYQRWFALAIERGDNEKAFDIAELSRRAKFYSMFKLGPRLLSLRVLFETPATEITPELLLERQSLTLDFKVFGDLSNRVADIKKQLALLPIVPNNQGQYDQQKTLLADLEKVSVAQELMLRPIALSRTKSPSVFPPVMKLEKIRAELPEKTAMLVFNEALGKIHAFLVDKKTTIWWMVIEEPRKPPLRKLIIDFLEALGNKGDGNRAMPSRELLDAEGKWKTAGSDLLQRLLSDKRQASFTELVIVPTGLLWYVPFEAMSVKIGNDLRPMIAAGDSPLTIRYAPTATLAVPLKTGRNIASETLVVYGKLASKDAPTVALDAIDRYTKAGVPRLVAMPSIASEPSFRELPGSAPAFATQIKELVVLDDIPMSRTVNPLDWTPFSGDKAKLTNTVASWLNLPWGGPKLVVMPGFHTPAENALRSVGTQTLKMAGNGEDIFLTAMALEACGAKTILMSRWRTGGRASYDLVGEFLKNLQTHPAADAWRQAILTVAGNPLELAQEPRVKAGTGDESPTAAHPFFWGAFILIDRGEKAEAAEPGGKLQ